MYVFWVQNNIWEILHRCIVFLFLPIFFLQQLRLFTWLWYPKTQNWTEQGIEMMKTCYLLFLITRVYFYLSTFCKFGSIRAWNFAYGSVPWGESFSTAFCPSREAQGEGNNQLSGEGLWRYYEENNKRGISESLPE